MRRRLLKHRSHLRPLFGTARFSLDHGRERHGVVNVRPASRAPSIARGIRWSSCGRSAARWYGGKRGICWEKISFERWRLGVEIANHGGISGRGEESFRLHGAQLADRFRDVVDVVAFGIEQFHVVDVAARNTAEDLERRRRFIEFVFARLEIGCRAAERARPETASDPGSRLCRPDGRDRARGGAVRKFDEHGLGESLVRLVQAVEEPRSAGDRDQHHEHRTTGKEISRSASPECRASAESR